MCRGLRTKRGALLAIAGGVLGVAIAGFAFIYFVLFPTSSPRPFKLAVSRHATPVPSGTSLAGTWTIASGSVAGYRVREKLGFLPAESDAVGRTSQITGHATVVESGTAVRITAAAFKVNVYSLKSNESMRDEHIHTIGIQSATYPYATFVLTHAVSLPASARRGKVAVVPVTGVFNIHGASRTETLPLQMTLSTTLIQAVGSLTFPWSRFNMTAPSVGGFVNVTAHATMEFDLRLAHA
jgi:polyisoprenoid-binding protein YceI